MAPKMGVNDKLRLPQSLAEVPEISLQDPLSKTLATESAILQIARVIDKINYLNQKKTDAFIEELISGRTDLAGLPFAIGNACRLREERALEFGFSLHSLRKSMVATLALPVSAAATQKLPQSVQLPDGEQAHSVDVFLATFCKFLGHIEKSTLILNKTDAEHAEPARIAALMQVLTPEAVALQQGLVKYLASVSHVEATRSLAKLAIFSEEIEVREAALKALKIRREKDYTAILVQGLSYPWPAAAKRASEAIVKLERSDLIPQLLDVLERSDPRAPELREVAGKKSNVVRELVRINHHHNCLLCHAPATAERSGQSVRVDQNGQIDRQGVLLADLLQLSLDF